MEQRLLTHGMRPIARKHAFLLKHSDRQLSCPGAHRLREWLPLLHAALAHYRSLDADRVAPDKADSASAFRVSPLRRTAEVRVVCAKKITTKGPSEFYSLPVSDPVGLFFKARILFDDAKHHLGEQLARKIITSAMSARQSGKWKNWAILQRLDGMKPKPEPWHLARRLAKENATLPAAQKWGPRGSINPKSMERHIHRLIDERKRGIKDGTWHGPGTQLPITRAAVRIQTE